MDNVKLTFEPSPQASKPLILFLCPMHLQYILNQMFPQCVPNQMYPHCISNQMQLQCIVLFKDAMPESFAQDCLHLIFKQTLSSVKMRVCQI